MPGSPARDHHHHAWVTHSGSPLPVRVNHRVPPVVSGHPAQDPICCLGRLLGPPFIGGSLPWGTIGPPARVAVLPWGTYWATCTGNCLSIWTWGVTLPRITPLQSSDFGGLPKLSYKLKGKLCTSQCNGKMGSLVWTLYNSCRSTSTTGLTGLKKLKFEHINLNSFSIKMRDLAAQVMLY